MEKIRIITDSASDIVAPYRDDVTVLPMRISFGEEEYFDGVTISHREFYDKLIESDELPRTSLISPDTFEREYEKAVAAGERAVVITMSGKLSGTYQSAVIAAEKYDGDVFVVDSSNVTVGERVLIDLALGMKDAGASAEEIAAGVNAAREEVHLIALLDTLEFLKMGGRVPKAAAFFGGMLSIKPVVAVSNGEVEILGKARGSKNGNNFLMKEVEKSGGIDFDKPFYLGYTGRSDTLLQKYIDDSAALWKGYTETLPICNVGATIGTHAGPDAIVLAYFGKNA